ncbi:MAG: hypothetical protein ACTSRP_00945 [Candidatus Helarchaeota archaeon]
MKNNKTIEEINGYQNEILGQLYVKNNEIKNWINLDFYNLSREDILSIFSKNNEFDLNKLLKALIIKEYISCISKLHSNEESNNFWNDIEPILKKILPENMDEKDFLRKCSNKLNRIYKKFKKDGIFKGHVLNIPYRSRIQFSTRSIKDSIFKILDSIQNGMNNEISRDKLRNEMLENYNLGYSEKWISESINRIIERYFKTYYKKINNKKVEFIKLSPLSRLIQNKKGNSKIVNELLYLGFRCYYIVEQVIHFIYRDLKKGNREIKTETIKKYIANQKDFYLYPKRILNNVLEILGDLKSFNFIKEMNNNRFKIDFYTCSLEAFIFSLYDDLLSKGIRVISIDELMESKIIEIWLTTQENIFKLLKEAERKALIRWERTAQLNQISLQYSSMEDLVDVLSNI